MYEAEQAVIGSILIDFNSIGIICNDLKADMFETPILGAAYLECQRTYDHGEQIDLISLSERLKAHNYNEDDIFIELKNCASCVASSVKIKAHAVIVINEYKKRTLNGLLEKAKKIPSSKIKVGIGRLITLLENLNETKDETFYSLAEITTEYKSQYFIDYEEKTRTFIGFPKLDDMLGGLEGGDIIIVGARPAVGKSAFATQITLNLLKQKKRVGFYNLEMRDKQMYERFVASISGINLTRIRRAKTFLGDEEKRFDLANEVLESAEDIYISSGSKSVAEIKAESRHMALDVIIVDYLQLVKVDSHYKGNRAAEVSDISGSLKALATELNVPIIVLSQLNRLPTIKGAEEPTMAELRESGALEQDASIVILLWNISESKKGVKIDKNRQGTTGKVVMEFDGEHMKFIETNESVKEVAKSAQNDCPF